MKKQEILFNGLPLNTTQTCTFIDTWYDQNKIYGPGSSPYYFDHLPYNHNTFEYAVPEVYITINKSRLKKYNGFNVYLNDGDEFEIEIFNPTTYTLGVKFKFNGKYISNNHLIFEPGQRFFLDRYIDTNNKFKFSTYTVEDNNPAVDNAIRFNGDLEIEFYKKIEMIKEPYYTRNVFNSINDNIGTHVYYCNAVCDSLSDNYDMKSFKETGKIDLGGKSDQSFNSVDMSFETIISFSNRFKILPLSQKPIEAKDLKPVCSSCNRKCKKHDKFCSNCGNKL